MALGILSNLGLISFISLIPLIILYLIKPKPKKLQIPSLMFILKVNKKKETKSIFNKIIKDWLFLFQFLILLFLAAAITQPWIELNIDTVSNNVVIVLDASASSQVIENNQLKFDLMSEKAKELLGSSNSIIVIQNTAILALEKGDKSEAKRVLNTIQPSDTESSIGEAILLAGEIIGQDKGRVFVLSDFINTKGMNPNIAKSVLESNGINVDFIQFDSKNKNNIGIINIVANEETSSIYIRNYNNITQEITLEINEEPKTLKILANSIEPFGFKSKPGITKVEIIEKDDFNIDNLAYISIPNGEKKKILLISNNPSKYLLAALKSSDLFEITIAEPPVVPTTDYDLYLLQDVNTNELLTGTIKDILNEVENGAGLIIHTQEGISYASSALPVILGPKKEGGLIETVYTNKYTSDVIFGEIKNYISAKAKPETLTIASVNNDPIIVLQKKGKGEIVYYGLNEKESNFKLSTSYPIFWNALIKELVGLPEISEINLKTGTELESAITKKIIILDKKGIYTIDNQKIAVNLLNEEESYINNINENSDVISSNNYELKPIREKNKYELIWWLTLIALIIVFLELLFIKYRGDV